MRAATSLAGLAILAAALLGGCGGSSSEDSTGGSRPAPPANTSTAPAGATAHGCALSVAGIEGLRVTAVSCGEGQRLAGAWRRSEDCAPPGGASRSACTVRSFRCIATATDRGHSVSCAGKGRSIAFTARR